MLNVDMNSIKLINFTHEVKNWIWDEMPEIGVQ